MIPHPLRRSCRRDLASASGGFVPGGLVRARYSSQAVKHLYIHVQPMTESTVCLQVDGQAIPHISHAVVEDSCVVAVLRHCHNCKPAAGASFGCLASGRRPAGKPDAALRHVCESAGHVIM